MAEDLTSLDLEPHCTLIVTHQHMLSDTPAGAMTVLRPTIKGQKVDGGPDPGNPCPFPEIVKIIHSLAYEITQSIKTNHPTFGGHSRLLRPTAFCLWNVYLSE